MASSSSLRDPGTHALIASSSAYHGASGGGADPPGATASQSGAQSKSARHEGYCENMEVSLIDKWFTSGYNFRSLCISNIHQHMGHIYYCGCVDDQKLSTNQTRA